MDFAAREPSLGYYYQVRYALFLILSEPDDDTKVFIESLDDIEIKYDNITQLHQTKFHLKNKANLTDRSTDFWKTIRIWSEQIKENIYDINDTLFFLITTQTISDSSILKKIKEMSNLDILIAELTKIANETTNQENLKGYQAFNNLTEEEKYKLISKIKIIDSSMNFEQIKNSILNMLRLSASPKNIISLFERLEGWWFNQCILHLIGEIEYLSYNETQKQIFYITESFKLDNLPIDFPEKMQFSDEEMKKNEQMTFIQQLNLINATDRMKHTSVSDYYRAFNQRSKWLREELLNPQEEIDYNKKLKDYWERRFDLLLDDCEQSDEIEKVSKGLEFYKNFYVKKTPGIYIRERVTESYVVLGSCHMLSDQKLIGWHPEYEKKLKEIDNVT